MNDTNCLRCKTSMRFLGTRQFLEGSAWAAWVMVKNIKKEDGFHVYACPQCGKVEFFLPEPFYKDMELADSTFDIELASPEDKRPPNESDLLKIKPGITSLESVYKAIGLPVDYQVLGHNIALCYPSHNPKYAHVVLLDSQTQLARLVAIYNEGTFTTNSLQQSYGTPETIDLIDGHEHLFFDGKGIAYLLKDQNEADLVYVQFFEPRVTLNEYIKANGFSKEIFTFHVPQNNS